jgi:hypothetical protein
VEDAVVIDEELGHAAGDEFEVGGAGEGFLLGGDEGVHGIGRGRDFEALGGGVAEETLDVGGVGELGTVVIVVDAGEAVDEEPFVDGGGAELGEKSVEELVTLLGGFEEETGGVLGEAAVFEGVHG